MKSPARAFLLCLLISAARPVAADELGDVYAALMEHPGDVALNLRYARLSERQGKFKWALPAYERALRSDRVNAEAKAGLARVRAELAMPARAR